MSQQHHEHFISCHDSVKWYTVLPELSIHDYSIKYYAVSISDTADMLPITMIPCNPVP